MKDYKYIFFLLVLLISLAPLVSAGSLMGPTKEVDSLTGPNQCSKREIPVHLTLTTPEAKNIEFNVPEHYLEEKTNRDKSDQSFIKLLVLLKDMSPACGSEEYENYNSRQSLEEFISIKVKASKLIENPADWGKLIKERYPYFIEKDKNGFKVYRKAKFITEEETSYKEFLIAPEGVLQNPNFIVCTVLYNEEQKNYTRSRCYIDQYLEPHLNVRYYIHHNELLNLTVLEARIIHLVTQFIEK